MRIDSRQSHSGVLYNQVKRATILSKRQGQRGVGQQHGLLLRNKLVYRAFYSKWKH